MYSTRANLRTAYKISDGNPDRKKYFAMRGRRQEGKVKIYHTGVKRWLGNLILIGSSSRILLMR